MNKQYITIPELAKKHNADPSQIRKKIKEAKIEVIECTRAKTKKYATAIAKKDLAKLYKAMPSLKATVAKATDIPATEVAKKLAKIRKWKKPDVSTVLKMCEARGIKLTVKKVGNRPLKVLSKKDFNTLLAEVNETPIVA